MNFIKAAVQFKVIQLLSIIIYSSYIATPHDAWAYYRLPWLTSKLQNTVSKLFNKVNKYIRVPPLTWEVLRFDCIIMISYYHGVPNLPYLVLKINTYRSIKMSWRCFFNSLQYEFVSVTSYINLSRF